MNGKSLLDTDFQPDDGVLPYDGPQFHRSGKVGDMTESDRKVHDANTRFRPDGMRGGYRALFAKWEKAPGNGGLSMPGIAA